MLKYDIEYIFINIIEITDKLVNKFFTNLSYLLKIKKAIEKYQSSEVRNYYNSDKYDKDEYGDIIKDGETVLCPICKSNEFLVSNFLHEDSRYNNHLMICKWCRALISIYTGSGRIVVIDKDAINIYPQCYDIPVTNYGSDGVKEVFEE